MAQILIIDDSIFTLKYYAELVTKKGHEAITAESGEEGIRLYSRYKPPIVFCDLIMPGIDGFEVFKKVKNLGSPLLFFFVTADVQEKTKKRAMEIGAKGLINKPLTEKILDEVLKQYGG